MKTRFQKLMSLVLVLVMLITMIPAGMFIATAEVSADLAAGLADIANTDEFVIKSVADWNAFAAVNNQFEGKTVKLGADIDAEGATLPILFQSGNARCTFDGDGYTIKNVGTAETPNPTSLLCAKSNLNVQNLTVENCHVAGNGVKGIVVDWQNCWSKYTFKNIKVIDSSVKSNDKCAGVIIGEISGNAGMYGVDFENIVVDGCSAEGTSTGGGWNPSGVAALAGYCVFNNGDYGATAKNIEVVDCTFTDNASASNVAGLFGYFRHHGGTILSVENAYVNATFVTPNSAGWTGVAAGLFQTANSSTGNTVTVKNVITDNTYPGIVQIPTIFYGAQATWVTENFYAVQQHNPVKSGWLVNGGNTVNGTSGVASNYAGVPAEVVVADDIPQMISKNDDGFITSVHAVGQAPIIPEEPEQPEQPEVTPDIVINSVDDWNTVATSGDSYSGKLIVLGKDIDFGGATVTPLFNSAAFYGTFDGQGYTIKNAKVSASGNTALIAPTLGGGKVTNVNFDNITVTTTAGHAALIAGHNSIWADLEISKINATNITINNSGTGNTGALIANHANNGFTQIVTQINIQGTVNASNKGNVGGVVGSASIGGVTQFAKITADVDVVTTKAAPAVTLGGFAGYYGVNSGKKIEINTVLLTGSITDENVSNSQHAGFVGKFAGVSGQDVSKSGEDVLLKDIILAMDISQMCGNSLILASIQNGNLVYENIFSTTESNGGIWSQTTQRWTGMSINGASFFNGLSAPWAGADPIKSSVNKIEASAVESLVHMDDDGFIEKIEKPKNPDAPDATETPSEYVIDSVEDWNAVAEMVLTFTGSTIKLGADLDFEGATIKPLFGNKTFHGTFDGQGFTIKNAVVEGSANLALIAPVLGGGKITNVNFDNITVSTTDGHAGLIAGHVTVWADLEISDINATNITINNGGTGNTGGLVGNLANNGYTMTVTKINLQGAVNHNNAAGHVGGMVGNAQIGGATKWSNIMVAADVFANQGKVANYAGGFAGIYGVNDGQYIDITNVVVAGSVNGNGSSTPQNAGFVAKFMGQAGRDIGTVKNIIVATNMTKACGNSITFAGVQQGNLVYSEVYSLNASNNGTWSGTTQRWTGMSYNTSSTFNGTYNPWAAGDPIRGSVMVIPSALVDLMVQKDEDGYVAAITSIAENDAVLPDYDTTDEFVINSVEDWKLLASSNKSFSGKTIKLGADIDAQGETLPLLILNMSATTVVFDGCGYAIKNVGTADVPNVTPLIAYQLGAATVKNVNFENINVSMADAAGMISFNVAANGVTMIENIKVVACNVTSTANTAGAFFGSTVDKQASDVIMIKNVNIDADTKISGVGDAGGLVGHIANVGVVDISNIYTKATITGSTATNYVGGLFGQSESTVNGIINITNCYVGGDLVSKGNGPIGGLAGRMTGYAGKTIVGADGSISFETAKTITVKNVILDCQFLESTNRSTVYLTVMQGQGYFNYENVMTTNTTSGNRPKPQWKLVAFNSNTMINGKPMNGEIPSPSAGDLEDIIFVIPTIAEKLVIIDEATGFVKNVNSLVETYTYQLGEIVDGKYAIRFVGVSQLMTEETIVMNVKVTRANGQYKLFTIESPGMERLTPFDDHNIDGKIVAEEIGVQKMLAATIYDIPVGEEFTFECWITMAMPGGSVVTSTQTITVTIDANGAPVVAE